MKNTAVIAILLISLLTACQKDPGGPSPVDPPDEQDTTLLGMKINTMSVLRNGKAWEISDLEAVTGGEDHSQILLRKVMTKNGLREVFKISGIPLSKGIFSPTSELFADWTYRPNFFIGWSYDSDQALGAVRVDTLYSGNHFEILRYDPTKRILEGKFEVKLIGDLSNYPAFWDPDKIISDTILLTEGKFVVQVPE